MVRHYRAPDNVLFRDLGGEAVLLDIDSGFYFGLDEVGTRVWTLLGQLGDPRLVCEALRVEYDVDHERLAADVEAFVATLAERGLIRPELEP